MICRRSSITALGLLLFAGACAGTRGPLPIAPQLIATAEAQVEAGANEDALATLAQLAADRCPPRISDRRDLGITATDDALPGGAQKTYFLGIIDVLIKYNAKKRAETFVKTFKAKREAISSVPPDEYAARFLRFCEDVVLKDAEAK